MRIQVSDRLRKKGISQDAQLRDVANQLAQLFYDKSLSECLGHSQSMHTKNLKGQSVTVRIDSETWHGANERFFSPQNRFYKTQLMRDYVLSMIQHAKDSGIDVRLELVDDG